MRAALQEVTVALFELTEQQCQQYGTQNLIVITFEEFEEELLTLKYSIEPEGSLLTWPDNSSRLIPGFPEVAGPYRFVLQFLAGRFAIIVGGEKAEEVEFFDLPPLEPAKALEE